MTAPSSESIYIYRFMLNLNNDNTGVSLPEMTLSQSELESLANVESRQWSHCEKYEHCVLNCSLAKNDKRLVVHFQLKNTSNGSPVILCDGFGWVNLSSFISFIQSFMEKGSMDKQSCFYLEKIVRPTPSVTDVHRAKEASTTVLHRTATAPGSTDVYAYNLSTDRFERIAQGRKPDTGSIGTHVSVIMQQTEVTEEIAQKALVDCNGDVAKAIMQLKQSNEKAAIKRIMDEAKVDKARAKTVLKLTGNADAALTYLKGLK